VADLFSTLGSVARALDAQRYGLDVAGQNIANVNTPGYARRTVDLIALAPEAPGTAGRGVDVVGIRALRDRLLESRVTNEIPSQTREAAVAEALSVVEASLGMPGASIDASLEQFFDAFAGLAEAPTSASARDQVLVRGEGLAAAFSNMAGRLDAARLDADRQARGSVDDVNALIERIAALNVSIGGASAQEKSLHARDEQFELVRQLSEQIDIHVLDRPEGGVDISVGNGHPVVVGQTSYAIDVQSTAPSGYAALSIGGVDVTAQITGGRLGGFLQVRDVNIPDYTSRLDTLAFAVATEINTLHAAGFDQTGAAGGDFFDFSTAPAGSVGAASALIVRAAVSADARLVAAGASAAPGDNRTARSIADLRQVNVLNGGTATLSDGWGQIVYRVARDTRSAADERDSRQEIVRQIDALRDAVSGVSLDEEAMQLMKFQRAYEANARFFQVIDQTLETLLGLSR
jgi:flagellar hook-associated protein 1 FlgK